MWSILLNSNTQWVMVSTMILGVASGLIGCFAYWKRQSLMSDALAHASLPGVIIAFLIFREKNLFILIIGAAISALIGAFFIQWIRSSTRITEDTAMGMILSIFYGLGIMLLTVANRSAGGNQSGLDSFIYGQAASMVRSDVMTMLILALLVIFVVFAGLKEWKIYLFDPEFAKGQGLSLKGMDTLYTAVLVTTIVIGIQAVGVILMAALLIIPPVSSNYWTNSFKTMLLLSAFFGGMAGIGGTIISAFGSGWPTGPFIVIIASGLFVISLVFGKEKGILINYLYFKKDRKRMTYEKKDGILQSRGAK
ncbi:metal ABC transporter permease [Oceanobacillus saliphilus]|uniref:metal ABC transporter permease n=1 Tax=Oceanobacillus saliphilus TaxID=2925834 RepID=UPI00201DCBE8|nr:metal ABC transporter permease [Oceanobacillus saliphilus]